jgi:hypothetical protein
LLSSGQPLLRPGRLLPLRQMEALRRGRATAHDNIGCPVCDMGLNTECVRACARLTASQATVWCLCCVRYSKGAFMSCCVSCPEGDCCVPSAAVCSSLLTIQRMDTAHSGTCARIGHLARGPLSLGAGRAPGCQVRCMRPECGPSVSVAFGCSVQVAAVLDAK